MAHYLPPSFRVHCACDRFPFLLAIESSNWILVTAARKSQIDTVAIHLNRLDVLLSRTALRTIAVPTLIVALAATSLPSAAQLQVAQPQVDLMPETALLIPRQKSTEVPSSLPAISSTRSFSGAPASTSSWLGTAIQLDAPLATSTGQYTRPKFHVGVPSESMRGFLNSAGFAADKCQLPMVRARTKSNGDGDINGTLWLFARCTFH